MTRWQSKKEGLRRESRESERVDRGRVTAVVSAVVQTSQ